MNKRTKLILSALLVMFFIYLSFFYFSQNNCVSVTIFPTQTDILDIRAQIYDANIQADITSYYDGTLNYYLFLPSYTLGKSITFSYADTIQLNASYDSSEKALTNAQSYTLNDKYTLHILVGSNLPTIYLDLKHDLSYIASDKAITDSGQATFLNADGSVCHIGALDKIQGRGNVTWHNNKKPFNISLKDSVSLYGISAAQDYCLISSYDNSFLRNQISDEIANILGLATMERQHINLYVNGEYQGIYELCEKISATTLELTDIETSTKKNAENDPLLTQVTTNEFIQDNGLTPTGKWWDWNTSDTVDITGGYILEADITARYQEEASGFALDSGTFIVCKEPTYLSKAQYDYISSYTQTCESFMYEALSSQNADTLATYIDMPSFVAKYLLEEVSKNLDCSSTSQYFYINTNGLLTAGPVWDYDRAYGCTISKQGYDIDFSSPIGFSARNVPGDFVWWQILYYQEDFYQSIITTYTDLLYPFLKDFTAYTIYDLENNLSTSAAMDYIRWNHAISLEQAQKEYHNQVVQIADFLSLRLEFLYNEWNL